MMKDATVSARIDNSIKNEAEGILQQLGIPVSVVINSLYRQIIFRRGVPFPLTVPTEPKAVDEMTQDELDAKLRRSYELSLRGEGRSMDEAFGDLLGSVP